MSASTHTVSLVRALIGSVLLLSSALLLNACGSSGPTQQTKTSRTLRLTAHDSLSGAPLDSARAVNRTFGDSLRTDSAGEFVLRDPKPALNIFDVSGYGYHTQRHVAALVEPGDSSVSVSTNLLPKRLNIDCSNDRPYFWSDFVREYQEDTTGIRLQSTDVFAKDGKVTIQLVVANDLTSPLFLPDNYGSLGHYDVSLYANDTRIPYTYENAPPDEGHRIYDKSDIVPVGPNTLEELKPTTLVVDDSIDEGTTIYARVRYTFDQDDPLEATSATTFPEVNLDSLQTPAFDTLRTAGEVQVPDSLVLQRDTTVMRVVGIDTTVTRLGYTLFSTRRDGNAASSVEEARNLLYVPDSVIARARRDSLEALAEARTNVPDIDTTDLPLSEIRSPTQIVERTNTAGLRSLLADEQLVQALTDGLPSLDMTPDSLLSFSTTLRGAYLQTPSLSESRVRRGLDTKPDSARADSIILSAPASDSLFRMLVPPSPDTTAETTEANPFVFPDPSERLAPDADSLTVDSLALTVGPDADSVTTTSVVTNTLSDPPSFSYWYAPSSASREDAPVFIADPSFFRLRAKPHLDTTSTIQVGALLPDRVGVREQISLTRYPQQVIRSPSGTYRRTYLKTWKALQENKLKDHYCEILPFPLQTEWKSASMH